MTGYRKGTTAMAEMTAIREAYTRAVAAIKAGPDPIEAFQQATALGELAGRLAQETSGFRGELAAGLVDSHSLTLAGVADVLGVSRARAGQLVANARKKGLTVTDPGTEPEPPAVAAAIITRGRTVLIEHRIDKIPPWTFPAAEMQPGESPAGALARRVPEEVGLVPAVDHVIGRRIHPKTGRVMIYLQASVPAGDVALGAPEDLDDAKWATVEETRELMPDMFAPVRAYLDGLAEHTST